MTFERIKRVAEMLKSKGMESPAIGIILGTGLGRMIREIEIDIAIPYDDIPDFPVSTVDFHHGELVYGSFEGKKIVAMHGRCHVYEGYTTQQITFPVRVMRQMGIRKLLVSNACGAMNTDFRAGELMLIEDHINLLPNPLIGPNIDELGPRFPDMSKAYSGEINEKISRIAKELGVKLHRGVYVSISGPSLETPAEYRWLRRIGADVVGMSTTPEVIVANHMNLPVAAISVITDECNPDDLKPVSIEDILANAVVGEEKLISIVKELLKEL